MSGSVTRRVYHLQPYRARVNFVAFAQQFIHPIGFNRLVKIICAAHLVIVEINQISFPAMRGDRQSVTGLQSVVAPNGHYGSGY